IRRQVQMLRLSKFQRDLVGIGSGTDLKVILQPSLFAVKIKVDTTIKITVPHPPKLRDVGSPLGAIISEEVVAVTGQALVAVGLRTGIRARELHPHNRRGMVALRRSGAPLAKAHERFACGEIKPVAAASGLKFEGRRCLPLVRLKNYRQTTEHV